MILESLHEKIMVIVIAVFTLMLSSTILTFYGDMDDEEKEDSEFGRAIGMICLIGSIIIIAGVIGLYFFQNRD